jgi:hypothetical protein
MLSAAQGVRRGTATFDDDVLLPCFAVALSEDAALLLRPREGGPIFESVTNSGSAGSALKVPAFTRVGLASFWGWAPGEWRWSRQSEIIRETLVDPKWDDRDRREDYEDERRRSSRDMETLETDLASLLREETRRSGKVVISLMRKN